MRTTTTTIIRSANSSQLATRRLGGVRLSHLDEVLRTSSMTRCSSSTSVGTLIDRVALFSFLDWIRCR
ncbi:hypothetical protein M6B38_289740 [Iris pallida]|uniref:Uncharacterized protein n=1 Tax=Iris pallida TaxID=29817 RepID=A0AAX6HYL5_IRIPA|nr:hypothetical protein M6B38_289740 [Iris pallida]